VSNLVVIADDLTGALDTGVQFAGMERSVVVIDPDHLQEQLKKNPDVIVVNTESRHLLPTEAFETVRSVAKQLRNQSEPLVIFKKIDSTFRGSISAEVAALAVVFPERSFLVAPAFPSQGRTTRNGICLVDGIPLNQSDFGQDPLNPVDDAFIPRILRNDVLQPEVVTSQDLNRWAAWTTEHTREGKRSETTEHTSVAVAVVDAATDADLKRIAAVWRNHKYSIIPVGSAGLAAHLLNHIVSVHAEPSIDGPLLLVNGSLNPVALRQARHAIDSGFVDAVLTDMVSITDVAANIARHLKNGRNVCLRTVLDRSELAGWHDTFTNTIPDDKHPFNKSLPMLLPHVFGQVIEKVFDDTIPGSLVVFGGDTVLGIVNALQASALRPVAELLPGIVASTVDSHKASPLLVTKAGGFGDSDLIYRILNRTRREKE